MDDVRFVRRCCSGDKNAWDEFLKRYSRLIYNYILSVGRTYGVLIPEEQTNEIFQTIVLRLIKDDYRHLKAFRGSNGCTLATWLRVVTMRQAVSALRSRKETIELDEGVLAGTGGSSGGGGSPSIPGQAESWENAGALTDCIKRLEPEDRYFLQLHLYAGLTLDMLKDHLRISRAAADMRKTRMLKQLRECFASKGFLLDSAA